MDNFKLPSFLTESANDIHKRMIESSPSDVSTIEGDIFWNNTRPVSEELARIKNISISNLLKSRFPQTAESEDLDSCGGENGVFRKQDDYAIQKFKIVGVKGTQILKDKIICTAATEESESVEFLALDTVIIDESGEATVNAKCTIPGTIGNVAIGNINILATPINGVKKVSNIEIVKYGIDIEDDESYRERILNKSRKPITSGNKYQYEYWAKEVVGVGDAKCFPTWNGPGTVKVVIVDSNKHKASDKLVEEVKTHIESVRPILAGVLTIASAVEKTISVTANVSIVKGYNLGTIKEEFAKLLEEYLQNISFKTSYISIAKIGNLLLNTAGVLDYENLKINNLTSNIGLKEEEIAVLGTAELGVM